MPRTELLGFPLNVGGTVKDEKADIQLSNGDIAIGDGGDTQMVTGPEKLRQNLEEEIFESLRVALPGMVAQAVRDIANGGCKNNIEEITKVVLDDTEQAPTIEVDFKAAGYTGTHRFKLSICGPGVQFPLESV